MDWEKLGKATSHLAAKATKSMNNSMANNANRMSRNPNLSKEQREEYKAKAEGYRASAKEMNDYLRQMESDEF